MTYLYVPLFAIDVFFYTDTATTEIYTYRHTPSLRDALPISPVSLHLSPTSAENLPDTLQPGAEGVDIRPGVVKAERGPHRRRHPEPLHQRMGAMLADADGNALPVKHGAALVGVNTPHHQTISEERRLGKECDRRYKQRRA